VTFELDYKPLVLASLRGMGDDRAGSIMGDHRHRSRDRQAVCALAGGSGYSKLWDVGTAVSSENSCQLRAANARERAARLQKGYNKAGEMKSAANSVTIFTGRGFSTERYVCLPDTRRPNGR
jgi:hypothetical protein